MSGLDMLTPEGQSLGMARAGYIPAGFGEVASSAFGEAEFRSPFGAPFVLDYNKFHERDDLIKQRTGVNDPLDLVDTTEIDKKYSNPTSEGRIAMLNEKQAVLDAYIQQQRSIDPEKWRGIKTKAEIEEGTKDVARYAREEAESTAARAQGFQRVTGSLVGGIGGSFTDPINLATLPLGAGSGMGILRTMAVEGLLNAGIEAGETPAIAKWQKELGYKYGVGEAAANIAMAGVGGAAFAGIIKGGARALDFAGSRGMRILDSISRNDSMPSAVRDAAQYMSRVAHVDEEIPFDLPPQREDIAAHREAVAETQDAIRNYREPVYKESAPVRTLAARIKQTVKREKSKNLVSRPLTLRGFIKKNGGITDPGGDLRANDLSKDSRFRGVVRAKGGIHPDKMLRMAENAGYFADQSDPNFVRTHTVDDLYQALLDEQRGVDRYSDKDRARVEAYETRKAKIGAGEEKDRYIFEIQSAADEIGIDASPDDIEGAARILAQEGGHPIDVLDNYLERQAIIGQSTAEGQTMAVRPDNAFDTMQRDVALAEDDAFGQSFEVDFAALVRDNPDMKIMIDGEEKTLKEISEDLKDNEKTLDAIKTCALKK